MRILFFTETYSNYIAESLLQLAKWAYTSNHEIHMVYDKSYLKEKLTTNLLFKEYILSTVPKEERNKRAKKSLFLYTLNELQQYQQEEMKLLQHLQPDLVVFESRYSLLVSCELAKTPYIQIHSQKYSIQKLFQKPKLFFLPKAFRAFIEKTTFSKYSITINRLRELSGLAKIKNKQELISLGNYPFSIDESATITQNNWLALLEKIQKQNSTENLSNVTRIISAPKATNKPSGVSTALKTAQLDWLPKHKDLQENDYELLLATETEDREAAYHLAYKIYQKKGFVIENSRQILTNKYDVAESTAVLIVKYKKKVVGTLTLLYDQEEGLPIANIFNEEFHFLKNQGEKLVEVSRLAIDEEHRNGKKVLNLLFNYVLIYTYHIMHYTSLLIEVNPRHKKFYETLLAFQHIGNEKSCPHVQNAPAVLLYLPLSRYRKILLTYEEYKSQGIVKKDRSLYAAFMSMKEEVIAAENILKQRKTLTSEQIAYFDLAQYALQTSS